MASQAARSSSPARSRARSIRRPCRPTCRSRRTRSPREAIAAAEAGAAILHLHARDPETGKPDQTPEAFARFLPRIKQGTNAAINITTGGSPYMTVEERVLPGGASSSRRSPRSTWARSISASITSLDKYKDFKFDWERPHLEATRDLVFRNTLQGHRIHPGRPATTTARASSSSATTSPISTTWPTSPSAGW